MSDQEAFARLIFYGVSLPGRAAVKVWLMPLGHLLGQWKVYKQFHGLTKKRREYFVDEAVPAGV